MEVIGYTANGAINITLDGVALTVPDDLGNRHRRLVAEWEALGNTIPAYVPPDVPPPHLNNGGLARFGGASPVSVYEIIKMSGVTRVSKGRYRAYHADPMPSDQYSAMPAVLDANPRLARVTARTAAFVEVRVTDLAGSVQDPTEVTIQTSRVIS